MAPNLVRGAAAAFASGVSAGTIASSSGSAMTAPAPRRNVRRDSESFEIYINFLRYDVLRHAHRERRAVHDAEDQRLEPVLASGRFTHDRTNGGHVARVEPASERI